MEHFTVCESRRGLFGNKLSDLCQKPTLSAAIDVVRGILATRDGAFAIVETASDAGVCAILPFAMIDWYALGAEDVSRIYGIVLADNSTAHVVFDAEWFKGVTHHSGVVAWSRATEGVIFPTHELLVAACPELDGMLPGETACNVPYQTPSGDVHARIVGFKDPGWQVG